MNDQFVHLHTHSHYSLLDGTASPDALVARAAELGMSAIALTDHHAMFGAVRFYQAARSAGIHPVLGLELVVGDGGHHLTVLAENDVGYRNLCRLSTAAMAERPLAYQGGGAGAIDTARHAGGHGPDPAPNPGARVLGPTGTDDVNLGLTRIYDANPGLTRIDGADVGPTSTYGTGAGHPGQSVDPAFLRDAADGLIVLTGCRRGRIPALLARGRFEDAKQAAAELCDWFGSDRFFVELQDHGLPGQTELNRSLIRLAGELDLGIVATNNVHYVQRADAGAHDALIALGAGVKLADERRPRFGSNEFYLKSAAEMGALFGEVPESLTNTVRIAERCRVELDFGRMRLPTVGGGVTDEVLAERAHAGARERFGEPLPATVVQRLEHELSVISALGLPNYFLLVADIVARARELGIPVGPGRGSAAGSLVAYCLHVTEVDPLEHGLVFERFLNPDRVQMPDIDVDVSDTRRDELLEDIRRRYGRDHVAQIATFGTLTARAALRDIGRVLDVPADTVDKLVRLIPNEPNVTLAQAQQQTPALTRARAADKRVDQLFQMAEAVEGTPRHLSVHAAGIVIGDGPLASELPLIHTSADATVTQYPMNDVQALGFLKMDFLGLRTLTVIDDTRKLVARVGKTVPNHLPLNDAAVYEAMHKFGTEGIFQLETPMFRRLVERWRPTEFSDIVALLALGRPGPVERVDDFIRRRHGRAPVRYHHPKLEPILAETYGIIVYQEQVMRIAVDLAGYSAGEADTFRRAMSAKQPDVLAAEQVRFVQGAVVNGLQETVAERIFSELETFAGYGFNKSHSVAYALLCYETAYLRTHFPAPYFAALLTSWRNNPQRIALYVAAARRLGVKVLRPDVNTSPVDFMVDGDAVAYGLEGVRHVGRGAAEAIVAAREEGPFASFADFCGRLPGRYAHRRLLQSLVQAGACDAFGETRAEMLQALDRVLPVDRGGRMSSVAAQTSLFGHGAPGRDPRRSDTIGGSGTNESDDANDPIVIELSVHAAPHFAALRRLLAAHEGRVPVWLRLSTTNGQVMIQVDDALSVTPNESLFDQLRSGIACGWLTRVTRGS